MTDCEYIKLCEEAFGATVPGCKNDHWRGCPNYDLCVLAHNQAIEDAIAKSKTKRRFAKYGEIDAAELEALKKPYGGG